MEKLISRNVVSMKSNLSQELDDSNYLWKQVQKHVLKFSRAFSIQVTGRHSKCRVVETGKNRSDFSHSTGTRKLVRGVDSHKNRLETGFRDMEIPSHHYLEKAHQ